MKNLVVLIPILLCYLYSPAQDSTFVKPTRAEIKAKKKAEKEAALLDQFHMLDSIIEKRSYVLEADYLSNERGRRIRVNYLLNFVKIDSSEVVLQIGSNHGLGYNGVGGITAKGPIKNYKVDKDEKSKTFYITLSVTTAVGYYDIFINISSYGRANASISGLHYGKVNWDGRIVPIDESNVYEGSSL